MKGELEFLNELQDAIISKSSDTELLAMIGERMIEITNEEED